MLQGWVIFVCVFLLIVPKLIYFSDLTTNSSFYTFLLGLALKNYTDGLYFRDVFSVCVCVRAKTAEHQVTEAIFDVFVDLKMTNYLLSNNVL